MREFIAELRDQFERFEEMVTEMSACVEHAYRSDTVRERRRKKLPDDSNEPDIGNTMTGREKFAVDLFILIIDKLVAELDRRFASYDSLNRYFGFPSKIHLLKNEELHAAAVLLQQKYHTDIQEDFPDELIQFRDFIKNQENTTPQAFLLLIKNRDISSVFPNVNIALRIYLTLPVTNASGERSFSKLALIKNRLRTTMGQNRLNSLAVMSLSSDIVRALDFTAVIKDFVMRKAQRKPF